MRSLGGKEATGASDPCLDKGQGWHTAVCLSVCLCVCVCVCVCECVSDLSRAQVATITFLGDLIVVVDAALGHNHLCGNSNIGLQRTRQAVSI